MKFIETELPGLFKIELEKRGDDRGFFARFFCVNEYKEQGLDSNVVQMNNSFTGDELTLRGMHYQLPPHAETRIVRCLKGKLFDMSLDLRPDSPTFGKSFGTELTPENRTMMYVPKGFAHGFMTMEPDTEMLYLVTEFYAPEKERVIRWNDPKFDMKWPKDPKHLSEKDENAPDFDPKVHLEGMEAIKI
jgi:dTDP-4-dehydrorhamnose 3,5-epimerase